VRFNESQIDSHGWRSGKQSASSGFYGVRQIEARKSRIGTSWESRFTISGKICRDIRPRFEGVLKHRKLSLAFVTHADKIAFLYACAPASIRLMSRKCWVWQREGMQLFEWTR